MPLLGRFIIHPSSNSSAGSGRLLITKLPLTNSPQSLPTPTALHLPSGSNLTQYQHNSLFIGYNSGVISITDIETSKIIRILRGDNFNGGIDDVTVTKICSFPALASSSLILAASADHYVRFFDVKQGQQVSSLLTHEACISGLDIDPCGGRSFITASHDGSVRLWDVQTKTLIQQMFPSTQTSDTPSPSDSPDLPPTSPPPLLEVDTGDPNLLNHISEPFKIYKKFDESINACLFMGSGHTYSSSTLPVIATANADSTCTLFL